MIKNVEDAKTSAFLCGIFFFSLGSSELLQICVDLFYNGLRCNQQKDYRKRLENFEVILKRLLNNKWIEE